MNRAFHPHHSGAGMKLNRLRWKSLSNSAEPECNGRPTWQDAGQPGELTAVMQQ
jgi:hypothetical protein